jgi:hypothetical protein
MWRHKNEAFSLEKKRTSWLLSSGESFHKQSREEFYLPNSIYAYSTKERTICAGKAALLARCPT